MPSLTIFANFYIDSDERYLRMVDSFNSFSSIRAEKWVINARGKHAEKTQKFLKDNLGDKLISFSLASEEGWFHDTKQMLSVIDTDFVFFWLEDHLNMVDTKIYDEILSDMYISKSEYLMYSWWHSGEPLKIYEDVFEKEFSTIYTFNHTKSTLRLVELKKSTYIIGMVGFFSNKLFKKIILKTSLILRQYPKQTPFNFEKGSEETDWLPIRTAVPKIELFANIDDDHNDPGYSLQSRKLYPIREKRVTSQNKRFKNKYIQRLKKIIPLFVYKYLLKLYNFIRKFIKYSLLIIHKK